MAIGTIARYTASFGGLLLGALFLTVGLVHLAAGVLRAAFPVVGGLVLLIAALAITPAMRRRTRSTAGLRRDVGIAVGALALALLSGVVFFAPVF